MTTPFKDWALLEVMGHRSVPGYVEDVELAGARMLRVRVPGLQRDPAGKVTGLDLEHPRLEQYYTPAAVYALTPTTEQAITRLLVREACYLPLLPPPGSPPAPAEEEDGAPSFDIGSGGSGAGDPTPARAMADLAEAVADGEEEAGRPF